jgi:hypothetical protein
MFNPSNVINMVGRGNPAAAQKAQDMLGGGSGSSAMQPGASIAAFNGAQKSLAGMQPPNAAQPAPAPQPAPAAGGASGAAGLEELIKKLTAMLEEIKQLLSKLGGVGGGGAQPSADQPAAQSQPQTSAQSSQGPGPQSSQSSSSSGSPQEAPQPAAAGAAQPAVAANEVEDSKKKAMQEIEQMFAELRNSAQSDFHQ